MVLSDPMMALAYALKILDPDSTILNMRSLEEITNVFNKSGCKAEYSYDNFSDIFANANSNDKDDGLDAIMRADHEDHIIRANTLFVNQLLETSLKCNIYNWILLLQAHANDSVMYQKISQEYFDRTEFLSQAMDSLLDKERIKRALDDFWFTHIVKSSMQSIIS
jgi:hypothetical protein